MGLMLLNRCLLGSLLYMYADFEENINCAEREVHHSDILRGMVNVFVHINCMSILIHFSYKLTYSL